MFITFEGGEGSGKTTAIKAITKLLQKDGYKVILTREPGGPRISEDIRNVILDKKNTMMDKRTEALLYAASRRQHLIETVWPNLKKGNIVICDRYLDSSLAYQGGARKIGIDNVLNMNMFATEGTFPDLTFLFDIEPKLGLKRISKNKGREVNRLDLERISFHNEVRKNFLLLAKRYPKRIVKIDASKTPEEIVKEVYRAIKKRLKK
ncbi:MAG: dTMP kinase [Bacilli bacterium]|nr:dTMP kinase [Bacilli bacterium]